MSDLFRCIWVYCLTVIFCISFGLFLKIRYHHPQISFETLTSTQSKFASIQPDPCQLHLAEGIPFSPPPDGNIQINFLCSNGRHSNNYLRFGALPGPKLTDALLTISQLNNFDIKSINGWQVFINQSPASIPFDNVVLKISDEVTLIND